MRSRSKMVPGMFPGKAHGADLLCKRVEIRFESCGLNTSQDARLLEILVKQGASLASRLSARLTGGVYDYADLRSRGSFNQALSLFAGTESQRFWTPHIPRLRIPLLVLTRFAGIRLSRPFFATGGPRESACARERRASSTQPSCARSQEPVVSRRTRFSESSSLSLEFPDAASASWSLWQKSEAFRSALRARFRYRCSP